MFEAMCELRVEQSENRCYVAVEELHSSKSSGTTFMMRIAELPNIVALELSEESACYAWCDGNRFPSSEIKNDLFLHM